MKQDIRLLITEVLDMALTQALERYEHMEPEEVKYAITNEWGEQVATLLNEFIFRATCNNGYEMPEFIHLGRKSSHGSYVALLCRCDG